MKLWQLIILIMLVIFLCVVPWVRGETKGKIIVAAEPVNTPFPKVTYPDGSSIHFIQGSGENSEQFRTRVCLAKMEQAMRAMDAEVLAEYRTKGEVLIRPFFRHNNVVDPEWMELWTTVKQECWREP